MTFSNSFKHPYIEGNFSLFYAIAWRERERWFWKKNEKFDIDRAWREVQKMLFWKKPPFWMVPMRKLWKKCIFDPQTVINNKLLFFLQVENLLLVNRSFNDGSGKPVPPMAVISSVLRTFTEDCNSSVSSSTIQFFTVNLPMTCQY